MNLHRKSALRGTQSRRARSGAAARRGGRILQLAVACGLVASGSALVVSGVSWAQWRPGGLPVSTATNYQINPVAVPDGAGGAVIAWVDMRSGTSADVYTQRVNAYGNPLWTTDGVPVCVAAGDQMYVSAVSDGAGGMIAAWIDYRGGGSDIYAQRVSSAGLPQWSADGVALCTGSGTCANLTIVSDGAGGAIVGWQELRNGLDYDVYAQRIVAGVAQWTSDGVAVCTATADQEYPVAAPDAGGGAIFSWADGRDDGAKVYAQRVGSTGVQQWTGNGVAVCGAAGQQKAPAISTDGDSGAIIAWSDSRSQGAFAQRINGLGAPQWTADGVPLCVAGINPTGFSIVPVGSGQTIVAWTQCWDCSRPPGGTTGCTLPKSDVYVQKLDGSGQIQWAADAVHLVGRLRLNSGLDIVTDDAGGTFIVWQDGMVLLTQHLNATGAALWPESGFAFLNLADLFYAGTPGNCTWLGDAASDGAGGFVLAWADFRTGDELAYADIYARRVPAAGLHMITAGWGTGGQMQILNPAPVAIDTVIVSPLEDAIFRIRPDLGYFIDDVTVDGLSLGVRPNLGLSHPTADHTLYAGFSNATWFEPAVTTPTRAYTTVVFPLIFAYDSVRAVLGELGPYDDTVWRLARWDPDSSAYAFGGAGLQTLEAGAGYWLITANGAQVQADGTPLTADTVGVKLLGTAASGWNQIANPFRFPIADTALRVLGNGSLERFTDGANTLTDALVWEWKGGANYDSVRTLQPRRVYWVRKNVSAPVNLVFPNWSSEVVSPGPATLPASAEWTVALTARQGEVSSMRVLAGRWARTAQSAVLRLEAPPGSPDGGLSLRLGEAGSGGAGRIADFTRDDGPWRWDLELSGAEAPGEIVLECEASSLPAGMRLWLSDEARNWSQELTPGEPMTLAATAGVRRLHLHASIAGEIPGWPGAGARLAAAYPNPFRDRIGLVLQLPRASAVVVTVFDVQGRQVRSFATETLAPGEHVLVWDGRDAGGRAMPGGMYLARCETADGRGTARIMKLP